MTFARNCATFRHSSSKAEMSPGHPVLSHLSPTSASSSPPSLLLWFPSPIFRSCQLTPCPLVPAFVPPQEQQNMFFSYIVFPKTSRLVCWDYRQTWYWQYLTISASLGKCINKLKQFLMMEKPEQPQNKMWPEMPTLGSAVLEQIAFFRYPAPVTVITAGYFWICSSGNYNQSLDIQGNSRIFQTAAQRAEIMPDASNWDVMPKFHSFLFAACFLIVAWQMALICKAWCCSRDQTGSISREENWWKEQSIN